MTERLILRALLALIKAQLRQGDYLTLGEVNGLEAARDELAGALNEFHIFSGVGRYCTVCGNEESHARHWNSPQ